MLFSARMGWFPRNHSTVEDVFDVIRVTTPLTALDFDAFHAQHSDYVWLTLQRFGVPQADLDDAFQEVFVVVQRKLGGFDGSCEPTTWLYGICRRVAAGRRRRASFRYEQPMPELAEELPDPGLGPEEALAVRQAEAQLDQILARMDLDRRAAFVMFEIDGCSCAQIAALTGVAIGTVYARLHAARKEFAQILERMRAAEASRTAPGRRRP
jgi:RNA polymerase sigma-70 factor (ECF subfamily)